MTYWLTFNLFQKKRIFRKNRKKKPEKKTVFFRQLKKTVFFKNTIRTEPTYAILISIAVVITMLSHFWYFDLLLDRVIGPSRQKPFWRRDFSFRLNKQYLCQHHTTGKTIKTTLGMRITFLGISGIESIIGFPGTSSVIVQSSLCPS